MDSYQAESVSKFDQEIKLTFPPAMVDQVLGGTNKTGEKVITVYGGVLSKFSKDHLLAIICHELGHIFGEINFTHTDVEPRSESIRFDGLEGEADYFGGRCLAEFFDGDIDRAKQTFKAMYEELYIQSIDELTLS